MAFTKPWSEEELTVLRECFHAIPSAEIAKALDGPCERSRKAVADKAERLGLRKCPDRLREMGRENALVRWNAAKAERAPA